MKKLTRKQRERDVKIGVKHRTGIRNRKIKVLHSKGIMVLNSAEKWIFEKQAQGYNFSINETRKTIGITLPEELNFSNQYESTVTYITAIRRLVETSIYRKRNYHLTHVNFDNLRRVSTSAALVLTAELSKWDDSVRQKLRPVTDHWDPEILQRFKDLGFFDLFRNHNISSKENISGTSHRIQVVRYIKARCGSVEGTQKLKERVFQIVGRDIEKWPFLHSGVTEAITNVTHHAYPESMRFSDEEKKWYLGGGYDNKTKELKIVFYDQGIGIPRSLPTSKVWERILEVLSNFSVAERKRDEVMLRAAMELTRTSTGESDRGRGLADLLEFIKQRGQGYLSVISLRGLYRFEIDRNQSSTKSARFKSPLLGTLIIWRVSLNTPLFQKITKWRP